MRNLVRIPTINDRVSLMATCLGILSLFSCTGESPADTTPPKTTSTSQITLLANEHPWVEFIQQELPAFIERTGISVEIDLYPEEQFRAKRDVELLSGISNLDLFMIMPGNSLSDYYGRGWVKPLDLFVVQPNPLFPSWSLEEFFPFALQVSQVGGKLHAIPLLQETSLLAFNRRILDKYGLSPPQTMEQLREVAGAVYEASEGLIYGITLRGNGASATSQWSGFMHSFGGAWVDEYGRAALHSRESLAALDFYGSILRDFGPTGATGNGWYASVSLFSRGDAAMIYDSNVFRTYYENPVNSRVAGDVGYTLLPAGPAGHIPHISHWALAINPGSNNLEASWLFIQWATSPEIMQRAQESGIPSAHHDSWLQATEVDAEWIEASLSSYARGDMRWNPPVTEVSEAREIVGRAIVAAILSMDIEDAAKTASSELDRLLLSEVEPSR